MNKIVILAVAIVLLGAGFILMRGDGSKNAPPEVANQAQETMTAETPESPESQWKKIEPGAYVVDIQKSIVSWSGKKPLIDGYINSGTLALSEGDIAVTETGANGSFVIDMNTLKVGLTAKKPNQETSLEGHLKSDRWFDVAGFPTATFAISSVTPKEGGAAGTAAAFAYDIAGDLTMKGQTHPVTFPATIYINTEGQLVAVAITQIDRTKWGITAGSGSFVDDLADNVIDDMISLSFYLVATK